MLVDAYHCLCVYRYFSRLLFENEAFNILESYSLPVLIEVFIFLSLPDSSNSRVDFSADGSSRPVEIFAASPSCSTSGGKAYFLFKLHDPTSGESGRQQQLTTRLSSCMLDMCLNFIQCVFTQSFLYLLIMKFEVCTVSYGPRFFLFTYSPNMKSMGHKSMGKNEHPYLTLWTKKTRLVRYL